MTQLKTAPTRVVTPSPSPQAGGGHGASTPPRPKRRINFGKIIAWIVLVILLIITIFPFYWMLRTALSSNSALYANSTSLLPADFSWGGFQRVFGLQTIDEAIADGC